MGNVKQLNQREKDEFLDTLVLASKDKRLLDAFLKDMLTPAEYREIATRWQILKGLWQGRGQREIMRDLKTGISTVTRGSRVLGNEAGGATQLLGRIVPHK